MIEQDIDHRRRPRGSLVVFARAGPPLSPSQQPLRRHEGGSRRGGTAPA